MFCYDVLFLIFRRSSPLFIYLLLNLLSSLCLLTYLLINFVTNPTCKEKVLMLNANFSKATLRNLHKFFQGVIPFYDLRADKEG